MHAIMIIRGRTTYDMSDVGGAVVVHNRDYLACFAIILIEHTPKHHLRKLPKPQKKP